jgi:hypothetical protein
VVRAGVELGHDAVDVLVVVEGRVAGEDGGDQAADEGGDAPERPTVAAQARRRRSGGQRRVRIARGGGGGERGVEAVTGLEDRAHRGSLAGAIGRAARGGRPAGDRCG